MKINYHNGAKVICKFQSAAYQLGIGVIAVALSHFSAPGIPGVEGV